MPTKEIPETKPTKPATQNEAEKFDGCLDELEEIIQQLNNPDNLNLSEEDLCLLIEIKQKLNNVPKMKNFSLKKKSSRSINSSRNPSSSRMFRSSS